MNLYNWRLPGLKERPTLGFSEISLFRSEVLLLADIVLIFELQSDWIFELYLVVPARIFDHLFRVSEGKTCKLCLIAVIVRIYLILHSMSIYFVYYAVM